MGARTAFPASLFNDLYDHLQKRAQNERISMNAMLNRLIEEDRKRQRRNMKVISPPSQNQPTR